MVHGFLAHLHRSHGPHTCSNPTEVPRGVSAAFASRLPQRSHVPPHFLHHALVLRISSRQHRWSWRIPSLSNAVSTCSHLAQAHRQFAQAVHARAGPLVVVCSATGLSARLCSQMSQCCFWFRHDWHVGLPFFRSSCHRENACTGRFFLHSPHSLCRCSCRQSRHVRVLSPSPHVPWKHSSISSRMHS